MWDIFNSVVLLIFALIAFVTLYVIYIIRHDGRPAKRKLQHPRYLAVLGSGGHTKEMIQIVQRLDRENYAQRVYVVADTDNHSAQKATTLEADADESQWRVERVVRAREVGESFLMAIPKSLVGCWQGLLILLRYRPHVLLLNGPGTCLPIALVAALLDMFRLLDVRIVFVESVCRVRTLSLTAAILYYGGLLDVLWVQWPELKERYPRSRLVGGDEERSRTDTLVQSYPDHQLRSNY